MSSSDKNDRSVIKSTRQGRLYIKTEDFFSQKGIRKAIDKLLESDIIRQIDQNKKIAKVKR